MVATLLAISHSMALRYQEQRVSAFQRASHVAQLRSLRLQLNPHFMFNALNSVAALICKRSLDDAEEMVETLSDFLRSSLEMAPEEKVTLAREIELQRLYLDVESIRFADRLSVVYEIDPEVGMALVPGLITQPIVENVIRHAVAPSLARVVLAISAERDGEWLRIRIVNSAGGGRRHARRSTGIGLSNVVLRLRGYYGERCSFEAGADQAGGYAVTLTLPYSLDS
jgi:two-component system LytT family sensor kinase